MRSLPFQLLSVCGLTPSRSDKPLSVLVAVICLSRAMISVDLEILIMDTLV